MDKLQITLVSTPMEVVVAMPFKLSVTIGMAYGGKEWCASHIHKVLTNEKMKGDTRCQKTLNVDYLTKKRAKNLGELPQYYYENTHPAIIEKDIWECVQLEIERQRKYCIDHKISTYHRNNEENPLSAKIICPVCGSTFVLLESKRVGEEGRKYWRCSSFHGNKGTEIEGQTFTPPQMALWSKNPDDRNARYRAKHRKIPKERQMLCTDVQVDGGMPEKAFVKAWNRLVDGNYRGVECDEVLGEYRRKELIKLLRDTGYIDKMDYELVLKTLSHIEVEHDGMIKVVFLVGVSIKT